MQMAMWAETVKFFVNSHLKRADEGKQSVLQEVDEEPPALPVWPFFNLGQVSQKHRDDWLEWSRLLHVHLSIPNPLVCFVSLEPPTAPTTVCHTGVAGPEEKETCTSSAESGAG